MAWFTRIVLEAQSLMIAAISFVVQKARFMDGLKGQLNPRREKAVLRMLVEGIDGFLGCLSAQHYRGIKGTTSATATRDMSELVALGAFTRTGGGDRYARYALKLELKTY